MAKTKEVPKKEEEFEPAPTRTVEAEISTGTRFTYCGMGVIAKAKAKKNKMRRRISSRKNCIIIRDTHGRVEKIKILKSKRNDILRRATQLFSPNDDD